MCLCCLLLSSFALYLDYSSSSDVLLRMPTHRRQSLVIDDETHDLECGIFTRCAIECEGLEGTAESPVGSINFASLFATGENYVIRKVKGGVKYLGDILSGGVGMNDIHTIFYMHYWETTLSLSC